MRRGNGSEMTQTHSMVISDTNQSAMGKQAIKVTALTSTVRPHLRCCVAIVTEPDHIFSWLNLRHLDHIEHRRPLLHALGVAWLSEWQPSPWHHRRWVGASGAVAAGRLGARFTGARAAVAWGGAAISLLTDLATALEIAWVVVVVHVTLTPDQPTRSSNIDSQICSRWSRGRDSPVGTVAEGFEETLLSVLWSASGF